MPSATISLTSKSRMHTAHAEADFVAAIESIKPTTIIGVSTIGGAFTQKVIEAMSRINERPVILALSNPTEHAECTPEQPILAPTLGQALGPVLEQIAEMTVKIKQYELQIKKLTETE